MSRARGSRGTGTVVERGGKWYVRRSVTLPNGRRSRPLGRPYPTREAAERARDGAKETAGSAPWTWGAIFDELLDELSVELVESRQESYLAIVDRHIRLHLRPRIGSMVARETTSKDLDRLWRDLRDLSLSPKYVKNIRGTLSMAATAAIERQVLDRNIVIERRSRSRRRKSGRRQGRPLIVPFNEQEAIRLRRWLVANWPRRSENALVLLCSLETGARRGETLGLRWTGVDYEAGTLTYVEQVLWITQPQPRRLELRPLKTDESERTISVSPLLLDQLRLHQERVGRAGEELVFSHPDGRLRNPDKVNDFVSRNLPWGTEIGLPRRPQPHLLRHTHASLLLAAGLPVTEVSARLGHSIPSTTLNFYAHAVEAHRDRTALAWDTLLGDDAAPD
jgi:integrase